MISSSAKEELGRGNRCWVCLGEGDDIPPMGTPLDAHDWSKPCSCSLIAHKKCLTNWILRMDLDKRRLLVNEADQDRWRDDNSPLRLNISVNIWNYIGINIRADGSNDSATRILRPVSRSKIVLSVKCPQCSNPLLLRTERDRFNTMVESILGSLTSATKAVFYSTFIGTSVASLIASLCATLSGTGIQILSVLCPESVQTRLLNIPARSLIDALNRNLLSRRFFTLTTFLPIYLACYRADPYKTSLVKELFVELYPLLFLNKLSDLQEVPRARAAFFLLGFSRYTYNLIFNLTLNRVYYNFVKSTQPSFIADSFSLEELDEIQRENEEEYEIRQEYEMESEKFTTVWQRIVHFFTFRSKLHHISISRRRRAFENCLLNDYSGLFNNSSSFLFLLTSMLWPLVGEKISSTLLSRSSYILKLLNRHSKTPDEAIFLRNILGCCVAVLVKDLINLYLAWRKLKALNEIKIVEFGSDEWTRDSLELLNAASRVESR